MRRLILKGAGRGYEGDLEVKGGTLSFYLLLLPPPFFLLLPSSYSSLLPTTPFFLLLPSFFIFNLPLFILLLVTIILLGWVSFARKLCFSDHFSRWDSFLTHGARGLK